MYACTCGRKFTTPQGLGRHKKHCGKSGIDKGYEYTLDSKGKKIYTHRKVMEEKLGRKLLPGEIVHHKDEIKRNNSPDNLSLTNSSDHASTHYSDELHDHQVRGSDVAGSKLNDESVKSIKHMLENGTPIAQIARNYNVDWTTIYAIQQGRTWKHIVE